MERRAGGPAVEVSNPGTDAGLGDQSPWALTPPDGTCLGKRNLSTEAGVGCGGCRFLIENKMAPTPAAAGPATGSQIPLATFRSVKNGARAISSHWSQI